jgi:hypothetical protein
MAKGAACNGINESTKVSDSRYLDEPDGKKSGTKGKRESAPEPKTTSMLVSGLTNPACSSPQMNDKLSSSKRSLTTGSTVSGSKRVLMPLRGTDRDVAVGNGGEPDTANDLGEAPDPRSIVATTLL